jgi:hypothetical protein
MAQHLKKAERTLEKQLKNPYLTDDAQRSLLKQLKRLRDLRRK